MIKTSVYTPITILILILSTIGCGFHLRGAIVIPSELKTIKITPDNPNETLQRVLRRTLIKEGVIIVSSDAKNVATLEVSEATFAQQVLTVAPNNQPQRIKLQISFTYSLYNKDDKLIQGPATITSSRDFSVDSNNMLSANAEQELIKTELYQDAIARLMRRITKEYVQ